MPLLVAKVVVQSLGDRRNRRGALKVVVKHLGLVAVHPDDIAIVVLHKATADPILFPVVLSTGNRNVFGTDFFRRQLPVAPKNVDEGNRTTIPHLFGQQVGGETKCLILGFHL